MGDGVIEVRRAGLDDVEALVPLFDAYRQFYAQPSAPARAQEFLAGRLARAESSVLLAEDGARTALGFVQLYPSFSSVALARAFILNDLFVAASARRCGVGRALLEAAVEYARSVGAVRLSLSTAVANDAAQRLYAASGWTRQTDYHVYTLRL